VYTWEKGESMYRLMLLLLCTGFCFSQILRVDSIYDPGIWSNPENIMVSDDNYTDTDGNNSAIILQIQTPADTNGTIDSIKVFLEQCVSDTTHGAWRIRPIINGTPGTVSADIMGTDIDQSHAFFFILS
jgi:hypothetical protein